MRLEQLTFTRFVAAISIVIFHYGRDIFPFSINSINFLFKYAYVGVSYFFILSGFVMIIAYGNKKHIEFLDYIKKRFARIYPVYFLAILILLCYFLFFHINFDYKSLILNITLLQSWIPGFALSFNLPGWSLAVEMFFYITFPFLFNYFYKKHSINKLIVPIFILFIGTQIVFHIVLSSSFYIGYPSKSHDFLFYFPLMHFSQFLIGNVAGLIFVKGVKVRNYDAPIIVLILLLFLLLKIDIGINFHNGMLAFVFVPLIFLISANNGILSKISKKKSLVFLGEISYGIYILQKPIFSWVTSILNYLEIYSASVVFYTALTSLIFFSAISYKFFEIPLRNIINKKIT